MGPGGFYDLLFGHASLPTKGVIETAAGDRLLTRLLVALNALGYRLADTDDGFWGVRYGTQAIVRPAQYVLPAVQFLGIVGHEIGSHLLERLNGQRQLLQLLGSGLAHYEQGNEGRALLREQVVHASWADFAATARWHEILRRHFAVCLGLGYGNDQPRNFVEVFSIMHAVDTLWSMVETNNTTAAQVAADTATWDLLVRVLKGTDGTGGAFAKDIIYLEGNLAAWQIAAQDPAQIMLGDSGKFDIANPEHLAIITALEQYR
jgi:hypothetical protein